MNGASARQYLTDEVAELLGAASVGLYELLVILSNSDTELDEDAKRAVARDVAADLVGRDEAQIYLLRWPRDNVIDGPLPVSVLDEPLTWGWLPSKLHFALIKVRRV